MRILLQLLAEWLWPAHPRAHTPSGDPKAYLRPLIVLVIVLLCGPEVFAAADLVALLDLLGVGLFMTAFAAGYRALGLAALVRVQRIFFPAEWTVFLKVRSQPSIVAHGLQLIGVNALTIALFCLLPLLRVLEVVRDGV